MLEAEKNHLLELLKVSKCPHCDGSGFTTVKIRDAQTVSRAMAMDAGDPSLEGSSYCDEQWEPEPCQWCAERHSALKEKS